MSERCPDEANEKISKLKALESKHNLKKDEIENILKDWDSMTYEQIDVDLNKIDAGGMAKRIVEKRTKEEGAEKAGLLWKYMECKDVYNTIKAKSVGGKRKRRRKRTKKKVIHSWDRARLSREKHKKEYCKKYYKGKYDIDKKGCEKDPKCIYVDMGSGGEWCYTKKRRYKKRRKRNLKKRTRRRRRKSKRRGRR